MEENWCALFIATQFVVTPEQAFEIFDNGKKNPQNRDITKEDQLQIERLRKQGIKYSEIGEMYGLSTNAVYRRIKYWEKKRRGHDAKDS